MRTLALAALALAALVLPSCSAGSGGGAAELLEWRYVGTDDQAQRDYVGVGSALYAMRYEDSIFRVREVDGLLVPDPMPRFQAASMTKLGGELVVLTAGDVLATRDGEAFEMRGKARGSIVARQGDALYDVFVAGPRVGVGQPYGVERSTDGGRTWTEIADFRASGEKVRWRAPGAGPIYLTVITVSSDQVFEISGETVTRVGRVPPELPNAITEAGVAVRQLAGTESDPFRWAGGTTLTVRRGWKPGDAAEGFSFVHGLLPPASRELVPVGFDVTGRLIARGGTNVYRTVHPLGAAPAGEQERVLRGPGCSALPSLSPRYARGGDSFGVTVENATTHPVLVVKLEQTSAEAQSRRTEDGAGPVAPGATATVRVNGGQWWMAFTTDTAECVGLYQTSGAAAVTLR